MNPERLELLERLRLDTAALLASTDDDAGAIQISKTGPHGSPGPDLYCLTLVLTGWLGGKQEAVEAYPDHAERLGSVLITLAELEGRRA